MSANAIETLRDALDDALAVFVDTQWERAYRNTARGALAAVEALLEAAKQIAEAHDSGEGFQWVGSEDDIDALDRLAAAVRRVETGQ